MIFFTFIMHDDNNDKCKGLKHADRRYKQINYNQNHK